MPSVRHATNCPGQSLYQGRGCALKSAGPEPATDALTGEILRRVLPCEFTLHGTATPIQDTGKAWWCARKARSIGSVRKALAACYSTQRELAAPFDSSWPL